MISDTNFTDSQTTQAFENNEECVTVKITAVWACHLNLLVT